jgi:hypothetical protein
MTELNSGGGEQPEAASADGEAPAAGGARAADG